MGKRFLIAGLAMVGIGLSTGSAWASCRVNKIAELPVTMTNRKPVVSVKINGLDARLVADSGAFYSTISHANAVKYGLSLFAAPYGFELRGVGGSTDVELGRAKDFTIAGVTVHNVEFIVGGSESGADSAGLLGQNVFRLGDVEYDLANGAIRLFRPHECGRESVLAYWIKPGQDFAVIPIEDTTALHSHTRGVVFVNGVRLTAMFDTGASTSVLSLHGAARAGLKPDSPGVERAGYSSGIGQRRVPDWIVPIASFRIDQEEIKSTRMFMADVDFADVDLLVGADFFLSHRIFVASSQRKLYLTYNGGPVFDLRTHPVASGASPGPSASDSKLQPGPSEVAPADASGFARRGAAYIDRHDLDKALADLTRAIELAPTEPAYYYERASARLANKQVDLALGDLDQALQLKPDHLPSLVLRAELRLRDKDKDKEKDTALALADLDAADKLAAKQDDLRLRLAHAYATTERLEAAIAQYDLWIVAHDADSRLPDTRNSRAWDLALLGRDLDKALADCNAALRIGGRNSRFLDTRGLVFLRRGELDKAIADFDQALKVNPKLAWSLYGRGLAKLRKGQKAEGQADIAEATAMSPRVPETARKYGLVP